MTQYITYRNGKQSTAQRIVAAIDHYTDNHNSALPAAVVVHPSNLGAATETVKALGLALPVGSSGGVASVECWLRVGRVK